ncbi:MAG: hypothetical protein ACTSSA_14010 [Candidatus Freyarchaeota archaeon]
MSGEIYRTVVEYLESRGNNWHFVFGSKVMSAKDIIKEMEKNKDFRKLILDEVVKTAVDMFQRSK